MKNFLTLAAMLACMISLNSCDKESNRIEYPEFQNPMTVTASSSNVVLEEDSADQTAVTFTWTKGNERGEGTSLKYFVELGLLTESGIRTLPSIEIPDGELSLSYTHQAFNELLLNKWSVQPETEVEVNVKVTARIVGGKLSQLPEVAETSVKVIGYTAAPIKPGEKPYETVCIAGTCLPDIDGYNMAIIPRMNWDPATPNLYTLDITFKAGSIIFVLDPDAGYDNSRMFQCPIGSPRPTLVLGQPADMVLTPNKSNDWKWNVTAGDYRVIIDVEAMTVTLTEQVTVEKPYETVCIAGTCFPDIDGYNMAIIPRMNWSPSTPNLYTLDITFKAGSIIFILDPDAGYDNSRMFQCPVAPNPRPTLVAGTPAEMVLTPNKGNDWKWNVTAGNYRVVIDVEAMTVTLLNQ